MFTVLKNNSHPSIILISWIDRGSSKIDRRLSNFVFDFQHWKWYHIKREGVVWQPTQHKISKLVYGDNISVPQCSKDHHTNLKYYRFSGLLIIKIASHTDRYFHYSYDFYHIHVTSSTTIMGCCVVKSVSLCSAIKMGIWWPITFSNSTFWFIWSF